jgi:hypothetical protein
LDRSADNLGLKDNHLANIADFMKNAVSDGRSGSALSLLLPNVDPSASNSAALAVEFVRGAMLTKAQTKRHADYTEFARAMTKATAKARESDPLLAVQLAAHREQVTTLTMEHSWKVAEEYHWRVMTRIEDGEYDLSQGGDTWSLTWVLSGRKTTKKKKDGGSKYDKASALFCEYHGWCAHVTNDCSHTDHKQGDRAPNYRARK